MKQAIIIDYGSGNLRSAAKSFERAGDITGHTVQVTADPQLLKSASHIVLPGVGAFADCMRGLQALPGMIEALQEEVHIRKKPFLGVCVGMQMLLARSFEHGEHQGLGWISGDVIPLSPVDDSYKIPHMGWNDLEIMGTDHPLLRGIQSGDHAYFVHSYHAKLIQAECLLATVEYGTTVTAIIGKDNIMGTQFHPEKSQATGLQLIENFLRI